jgi:hypothetical protein
MPLRYRLLISALIGLAVSAISCDAAYQQFCGSYVRATQSFTMRDIGKLAKAVEAYRRERRAFPKGLKALGPHGVLVDRNGTPTDYWYHPLHYSTDGKRYEITSYGADGRPGGAGLDCDLSSRDLARGRRTKAGLWGTRSPLQATPTFRQFLTYPPNPMGGSTRVALLVSALAGAVVSALAFRELGKPAPGSGWRRLVVAVVGALVIAIMYLIPLDMPVGGH